MTYRIFAYAGFAALVPAASLAEPTLVVEATAQPTALVSFADLDLGKPAGRERLETRIRGAARNLCIDPSVLDLQARMDQKHCYAFAIASAAPQVERAFAMFGNRQYAQAASIRVAAR